MTAPNLNPQDVLASRRVLLDLIMGLVPSRSIHVIAELGVADQIALDGEAEVDAIARAVGADSDALHRILRVLEPYGVFVSQGRLWSHSPASELLRSDHPASLRSSARMIGSSLNWDGFAQLEECARTGRPPKFLTDVGGFFGYLSTRPADLGVFDESMTAKSYADIAAILDAVDFGRFPTIADVGGGRGHLLQAILDRHHDAHGVLFELPQVADEIVPRPDGRMSVTAGDFFAGGLPTADLTMLMQVIHDWNDRDARTILQGVAAANEPGSTLMLFEMILAEGGEPHPSKVLDVIMLAVLGGRERTSSEYERLLDQGGYDLVRIAPTKSPISVIEARRR